MSTDLPKAKEVQLVYDNGNKTYMFYSPFVELRVAAVLERVGNTRVRIWYGDTERPDFESVHGRKPDPGHDWGEENDVTGTITNSMGPIRIPLIKANSNMRYCPSILTDCIIRIMTTTGRELYRHPNYHSDYDTAIVKPSELAYEGYTHAVVPTVGEYAGQEVARFRSERAANNYLAFMQGKRFSK